MNRKSQLQKKLALVPAPKPPAGLAERIKNEIPKDLRFNVEAERERLSSSIAVNLRVAASILLLISTLYLAVKVVDRTKNDSRTAPAAAVAPKREVFPDAPPAVSPSKDAAAATPVESEQRREAPARQKKAAVTAVAMLDKKQVAAEPVKEEAAGAAAGNIVAENTPRDVISATAPIVTAPAPPPSVAEKIAVAPQAQAPALGGRAMTAEAKTDNVRRGRVDEEFVQRFVAPAVLPTGIVLDVEAAQQPLTPGNAVLRASFDCGATVHDLMVDVLLGPDANASAHWLAVSWRWGSSDFANSSRSTLVEFALPNGDAPVATVRARYRIGGDPAMQTLEKVVRTSDVRSWSAASPRMKAGALAALWKAGGDATGIINTARASGLNELADAIEKR